MTVIADLQVFCAKKGVETISAFDDRWEEATAPELSASKLIVKVV